MKLTAIDLDYINDRLKNDIKSMYQEPYDEIKDHIITAIEVERESGDGRIIADIFQKVTDRDFGGYLGVKKIIIAYELAYRSKLNKTCWANIKYYLKWQTVLLIMLFVITGFYLPQNKVTIIALTVGLIAAVYMPAIYYIFYQSKKTIKTDKGKVSIVKYYIHFFSTVLGSVFPLLIVILRMAKVNPVYIHPVVYILLLSCFVIYGLSSMRLCRQEFKLAT